MLDKILKILKNLDTKDRYHSIEIFADGSGEITCGPHKTIKAFDNVEQLEKAVNELYEDFVNSQLFG